MPYNLYFSNMTQAELDERINQLEEGDELDLLMTATFQASGQIIQKITPKAILVNHVWIPKSQIEHIDDDNRVLLGQWWDRKKSREKYLNR